MPVTVFGARDTTHSRINDDRGVPDNPATRVLFEFVEKALEPSARRRLRDQTMGRW